MKYITRLLTLAIVLLSSTFITFGDRERVAFVLSGSPRSFIHPFVHETIRRNLLIAFCPRDACIADVFVRVSTVDNKHQGFNATGFFSRQPEGEIVPKIKAGLSRLRLGEGTLTVNWVEIGSDEERREMIEAYPSTRHR